MGKAQHSLCTVSNTTAIAEAWSKLNRKVDMMFAKKAFVHWLALEGVHEAELAEAKEDLAALEKEYEQFALES